MVLNWHFSYMIFNIFESVFGPNQVRELHVDINHRNLAQFTLIMYPPTLTPKTLCCLMLQISTAEWSIENEGLQVQQSPSCS